MIRLRTLGTLDLTASDGARCQAALAQPRRLGVLLYLALAAPHGLHRRDTILGIFWPEYDQQQARHALRQAILWLRRWLGQDIFLGTGNQDIGVNTSVLWCDAAAFEKSFSTGRYAEALSVYGGELLPGFFLKEAPEFERWLEGERARLRREAATAAWSLAEECITTHDLPGAEHWAHLAAARQPDDESAIRRLIELLDSTGNRAGALRVYEQFAKRVSGEYGLEPSPETRATMATVRTRSTVGEHTVSSTINGGHPSAAPFADDLVRQPAAQIDPPSSDSSSAFGLQSPADISTPRRADPGRPLSPLRVTHGPTGAIAVVLGLIAAGTILAMAAGLPQWRRRHVAAESSVDNGPVGIAVLPFDTPGDTTNAYFANGIANEIRSKLSALPGLRVIASSTADQYRHTQKPAQQIGQELGVRYLLTGHIQWEQSADGTRRVRVSPELVEVRKGAAPETRWQQSYDTTLADVFAVQTAVATLVADRLGLVLSPPAETRLATRPTQNLAAYDAYLRSVALDGTDPATFRRALAAAEEAVARDSDFAAAWARVSLLQSRLYDVSIPTPAGADAARRAAERAVILAPATGDAYYARGTYHLVVTDDLIAARTAYETAVKFFPSSALMTGALGGIEAGVGQMAAGLRHIRQAVALDPRSPAASGRLSFMLLRLRRYPEARAEAERGLTIDPASFMLIANRATSFLGEGDLAGARASLRDAPPTLDRATLVLYVARRTRVSLWASHFSYWPLDSSDRTLVLTLPPSAFDNNPAEWARARADLYWLAGDTVHARRYADSAREAFDAQLRTTPDLYDLHLFRGLALAYLGRREAAVQDGTRGLALAQSAGDQYRIPHARYVLAQIYLATGDRPRALDQLEALLSQPDIVSPAWLKIDPTWAPLRGDSRFERLLGEPAVSAIRIG